MTRYRERLLSEEVSTTLETVTSPVLPQDYTTEILAHFNHIFSAALQPFHHKDQTKELVETANRWLSELDAPLLSTPLTRELTVLSGEKPTEYKKSLRSWELIAPGQSDEALLHHLISELHTASSADWMVSFTRHSGIQALVLALQEAERKRKKIRIITSFYMNITEAKALRTLLQFKNVEVRIFQALNKKDSFHPKAYLFKREKDLHSAIIGSSNLSKAALTTGHEWNVRIPHSPVSPLVTQAQYLFDSLWESNETVRCNPELLASYDQPVKSRGWINQFVIDRPHQDLVADPATIQIKKISPNEMQKPALEQLEYSRQQGHKKAMIIAATGTGKTYLAAFDAQQTNSKRVLFIAHRGKLLSQAEQTFRQVFADSTYTFGRYQGNLQNGDTNFVFATVQTLSRPEHLERFQPDTFDYIVIDEFHHASSATYQRILDYFTPRFLLGLTATPERTDGMNVFSLVDHNVAYEIRLYDALNQDLLCPFHYYGIQDDDEIDYSRIAQTNGFYVEKELVQALERSSRTDYIVEMMNKFGFDGEVRTGLGFCVNIEHAKFMEREFKRHHIEALAVTSEQSESEREEAIARLENPADALEFIFTVDLFNEGVDIPAINVMLFLRPTESPTVFIQQLGRGLRKHENKSYVTVLDFIGNSHRAFVAPLVLSGQQSYHTVDRYHVANAVKNHFPILPEGSLAILDSVTERFIVEQLKKVEFSKSRQLRDSYQRLMHMIGEVPSLLDLVQHKEAPAIELIVQQWRNTLRLKQLEKVATDEEIAILNDEHAKDFVEQIENLFPIREPFTLLALQLALAGQSVSAKQIIRAASSHYVIDDEQLNVHLPLVSHLLTRWATKNKNDRLALFTTEDGQFYNLSDPCLESLQQHIYLKNNYLPEFIRAGLIAFNQIPGHHAWLNGQTRLIVKETYSRSVIQRLLASPHQEGSWREGVAQANKDYVLFVNLHKDEALEEQLKYQDYFISRTHFHWQSQSIATANGKAGQLYKNHVAEGVRIHLFVRKAEKEQGKALPFTYFGELEHETSHGEKPITVIWKLKEPLTMEEFISWQKLS